MKWVYAATVRSWWVWLFTLICYAGYDYAATWQTEKIARLETIQRERRSRLAFELARHDDLLCQIQSQSDPMWIEIVLMKGLGVAREGETKVFFEE